MDKASIMIFSNTVRNRLYEETKNRAANYGIFSDRILDVDEEFEDSIVISGRVFNRKIKRQREQLVREVSEKGYDQMIDEVTYTWFNRFVALKFMEENGYLPENVKVFSSSETKKTEPDILSKSLVLDFLNIDRNSIINLKSAGKDEELYKYLTLSLCNYLNTIMPFLFENIEDHTELLFPDKLLHTDSILRDINSIIKEEDWKEVEIIGWIYQDYIAQKKDILIHAKKQYQPNQIATVTQLFTPKWIVRYMVQNSLGRYWLEAHPNKELQSRFEFYLESREDNHIEKLKDYIDRTLSPENIKFLDPAMGSAHILVYAFDVFYELYKISGYLDDEIPELILTKNLYGLEIDNRATQLAGFALLMKARQHDKRLFEKKIELNIVAFQETNNLTDEDIQFFAQDATNYSKVKSLFDTFKDAKTYGSLTKIGEFDHDFFMKRLKELEKVSSLRKFDILHELKAIIKQAEIMTRKYDIAVTNPPYLNAKYMPNNMKEYLNDNYSKTKSDVFAGFIENMTYMVKLNGHIGIMCPFVWMFIQSHEELRRYIIKNKNISSLVQLEYSGFEEATVPICTFTLRNYNVDLAGEYIRLSDFRGAEQQSIKVLEAAKDPHASFRFTTNLKVFSKIPESPIAYWASNKVREIFENSEKLGDIAEPRQGMATSDNNRFLRLWNEVDFNKIGLGYSNRSDAKESKLKWFPYNKGGEFRKWYGNQEFVVNWENDGFEVLEYASELYGSPTRTIKNMSYYFKEGITYSFISSSKFGVRYTPLGFIFDVGGSTAFSEKTDLLYITAFLTSKITYTLLKLTSPTLNFQVGDLKSLPIIFSKSDQIRQIINCLTQSCIDISREEWDTRETSWGFKKSELLRHKTSGRLKDAYDSYTLYWKEKVHKIHANEEELNRLFIDIYDISDEMTSDVPFDDITILREESEIKGGELVFNKEIILKQFISYAVGCMFGRYSPDQEGIILANKGETIKDFCAKVTTTSFMPDADNIIPVLEDEYFKDDIVSRFKEFLKATFGAESLAENLDFIAGAISKTNKTGESSEKIIREYFLKSFFKDHARTYHKRPIYWFFTSGKDRGFNTLVYMHRYDKTILAKMRTDYLLELEGKIDARIAMFSSESARDTQEKDRLGKLMHELVAYDEKLNNKALKFIDIDLDNGVTENYAKFEGLVEEI